MGRPYESRWVVVWHDWNKIELRSDGQVLSRQKDPYRTLQQMDAADLLTSDARHLLHWACYIHDRSAVEAMLTVGLTNVIKEHASYVTPDQTTAILHAMDTLTWGVPGFDGIHSAS